MFFLRKPTDAALRQALAEQARLPLTYDAVGMTQGAPPPGYTEDHNRVRLGTGAATWQQATAALRRWDMFALGWAQICWPDVPQTPDAVVGILARLPGGWSLNACKIVYRIEETGVVERIGFAYGTLPDHVARGEECFAVEWHHADDSVWYDIRAFSQPKLLARLGYPFTRFMQKRFARASKQAMLRAVGS